MKITNPPVQSLILRVPRSSDAAQLHLASSTAVLVLLGPNGEHFHIPFEAYVGTVRRMDVESVDLELTLQQRD